MNKINKYVLLFISALCMIIMFGFCTSVPVLADEDQNTNEEPEPFISLIKYSLSETEIVPGNSFVLELTFKNNSDSVTSSEALLTISNPAVIIPSYSTVSQVYLGKFAPGEQKIVALEYNTVSVINSSVISLGITVESGARSNYVSLSLPVSSNLSAIAINSHSISNNISQGDNISASVNFRVKSVDNLSNVAMSVYLDDVLVAKSTVGNMSSGASKSQSASFYTYSSGTHTVSCYIQYTDGNGNVQNIQAFSEEINVLEKELSPETETEQSESVFDLSDSDITFLVGCALLIVCLIALIVIVIKKQK